MSHAPPPSEALPGGKIILVGPVWPYRGGIAHYTTFLARALSAAGGLGGVVSFRRQYPSWLYPGQTDKDPSREPIKTPAEFLLDPLYPWTWARAVRRIAAAKPQLVVIQWWTTFWGMAFAALALALRLRGIPTVYVLHNVLPHEARPWDRLLARLALAQGWGFVAQTGRERERLLDLLPGARVFECSIPPYHALAESRIERTQARSRLGLADGEFTLLSFGFVRPYKGVHTLIEALGILHAQGKKPRLLQVGEFWQDKAEYLEQIERLGLAEQIRIEDRYIPDEEIGIWFSAADCLTAAYSAGTQSAAAGTAIAYGLPMIVSLTVAEGIAPEHRSLLAAITPPGDIQALAGAIGAVMDSPPPRLDVDASADDWQRPAALMMEIAARLRRYPAASEPL